MHATDWDAKVAVLVDLSDRACAASSACTEALGALAARLAGAMSRHACPRCMVAKSEQIFEDDQRCGSVG